MFFRYSFVCSFVSDEGKGQQIGVWALVDARGQDDLKWFATIFTNWNLDCWLKESGILLFATNVN